MVHGDEHTFRTLSRNFKKMVAKHKISKPRASAASAAILVVMGKMRS